MKRLTACLAAVMLGCAMMLCACSSEGESSPMPARGEAQVAGDGSENDVSAEADGLRIGSMKGPTSVGLAFMMQQEQGDFTVVAAADELTALLLQDELDIALVPANVAAVLFQRTEGRVQAIDVNTLGVLYGVSLDGSISSVEDLRGRTVFMTGKGTVPEYTFSALLAAADMSFDDVTVEFCSEPAEVAAQVAQNGEAVGILPQPYATAVTVKNPDASTVLDLSAAWAEVTGGQQGDLVTGVTVAKASTIDEHRDAIGLFLERHGESAAVANADPEAIAATVAELGIIDNEELALKAIPRCNVVCLTGEPMRQALSGYLESLYRQNPEAIGGVLPDESFYYIAQ